MTTEAACHSCGHPVISGARFCQNCGADVSVEQSEMATASVLPAPRKTFHEAALELLREETLGDYEILSELGRGGMATVYLAHDIALDRKVAIKVMSSALFDEGLAERFRREARTAAALNHPHIIPIYSVRDRYPLLFFVMKFIAGQSLDPIVKEAGALPIPMVRTIMAQAGSALGYAHRRGVVHRDVKPANVMIDDEGWVVVTDFGIAKVSTATGLTVTGVTVGTPAYMSPEQCLGKEVTGASDQYSLGVVAYEMLTGRPPFRAASAMAMMYAHFNETPKPILELRPDCPPDLAATITRMLEKEPGQRWPSIDEAVSSLGTTQLLSDDPTRRELMTLAQTGANFKILGRISTPTSPVPPAKRTIAGSSPPSGVPAVAPTVVPASASASPPQPGAAPPPAPTQPLTSRATKPAPRPTQARRQPARSRASWLLWAAAGAIALLVAVVVIVRRPTGNLAQHGQSALAPVQPETQKPDTTGAAKPPPAAKPEPKGPAPVGHIIVAPVSGTVEIGGVQSLTAEVQSSEGVALRDRPVTWSSTASRVATVDSTGTVRGVAAGRAMIIAAVEGKADTARITVEAPAPKPATPPAVASVTVAPAAQTIRVGENLTLRAYPADGRGRAVDEAAKWSVDSRGGEFVSVSSAGVVQGRAPGTAVVTATVDGKTGSATITVTPIPVANVTLQGPSKPLKVGDTVRLTATPHDAAGAVLRDRPLSWLSSNSAVATVAGGLVTAVGPGTTIITARSEERSDTHSVSVEQPAPPAPAPTVAVDPAAERAKAEQQIRKQVDGFIAALNTRDIAKVRQANPNMSSSAEASWANLFSQANLTGFSAALEGIQPPRIEGDHAEVLFQILVTFEISGGNPTKGHPKYLGLLQREGGDWHLQQAIPTK